LILENRNFEKELKKLDLDEKNSDRPNWRSYSSKQSYESMSDSN